jgi:hypothetical protein
MEIERKNKLTGYDSEVELDKFYFIKSWLSITGEMEDPCSNCDGIDLHLDEICPECGRDQHSD